MFAEKTEKSTMQLSQCGTVLISSDHRLHALECFYCDSIYTLWEEFIKHVKENHKLLEQLHKDSEAKRDVASRKEHIINLSDKPKLPEKFDLNCELSEDNTLKEEDAFLYEECLDVDLDNDMSVMDNKSTVDPNSCIKDECLNIENETEDFEINEVEYLLSDGNEESDGNILTLDDSGSNLEIESTEFLEQTPEEDIFAFIEIIRRHPVLWKMKSNSNINHQKYNHTLEAISKQLNLTPKVIENHIRYLMSWFQPETKFSSEYKSMYNKYFEKCNFLANEILYATSGSQVLESNINAESNVFPCPNCDKVFSKKKYLNVHARRHAKDFAYKCKFCDKRTVTSTDMTTHMRVHTGEKPYVCDSCGKSFKTCSVFNAHKRKHELPQFQCSLCPKTYFNSHDLKNHTNAHLNKRDYSCEFCSKAFTSAKILYSHKMNAHSELRKTFCKICRRCFTNVKYHMKSVHQEINNPGD